MAETSAALGFFYMLWQLILRQPVQVTAARITRQNVITKFEISLELFALEAGQ